MIAIGKASRARATALALLALLTACGPEGERAPTTDRTDALTPAFVAGDQSDGTGDPSGTGASGTAEALAPPDETPAHADPTAPEAMADVELGAPSVGPGVEPAVEPATAPLTKPAPEPVADTIAEPVTADASTDTSADVSDAGPGIGPNGIPATGSEASAALESAPEPAGSVEVESAEPESVETTSVEMESVEPESVETSAVDTESAEVESVDPETASAAEHPVETVDEFASDTPVRTSAEEPPVIAGLFGDAPPLRALAARHGVRIGNAAPSDMDTLEDADAFAAILAREFDILTPENAMKMVEVQPERGRFDWTASDRIVRFAERHGMLVHGHPLLWKEQIPSWARALDKVERAEAMREHLRALVSRYRGRIDIWDVVNEALEEDGRWRHTLWYRAVGSDYLREAFALARELDPEAALVYNDYGISWERPKSDALHALLADELARGTPIDGVGFQMHLTTGQNRAAHFDSVRRNFERFAALGLDLYITELDVATDWRRDSAEEAEMQAEVYAEVLRLCLEQPRCRAVQIWGLSDEYAWRGALSATPLGEDFAPKPAFHALRRVLEETPVALERLERLAAPAPSVRP